MVNVTCAIIVRKGLILITQRGEGMDRAGKWEFPGGKMAEGETRDECIIREIKEELNIDISIMEWLKPVEHSYPDISIRLIPCMAKITKGTIKLIEHSKHEWVKIENLLSYDWSPADIAVVNQEFLMMRYTKMK